MLLSSCPRWNPLFECFQQNQVWLHLPEVPRTASKGFQLRHWQRACQLRTAKHQVYRHDIMYTFLKTNLKKLAVTLSLTFMVLGKHIFYASFKLLISRIRSKKDSHV